MLYLSFALICLILFETTILLFLSLKKSFLNYGQKRKIYVDTSSLMDGRILKIAKTGFLGDSLIIPRSVLREMQLLADGKDAEKRSRARFGLDIVNELERVVHTDVVILSDQLDHTPVDDRLIQLAKENHGLILTNDYNLGKVAATMNIDVLNVNELVVELRADYLPGEQAKIKITGEGSNPKQGIGYLPDGTMVVVDEASKKVGQIIEIEFIRFLQTNAGRMMFAKPIPERRGRNLSTKTHGRKRS